MSSKEPTQCALEYSQANLERNRKFGMITESGVVYDEEIAGPGGMSFVLLRERVTTQDMLDSAVRQLRRDRDVVGSIKVTPIIFTSKDVEAEKHALDEWTKVYLAPTNIPSQLKHAGGVFRGMNDMDEAMAYSQKVADYFAEHGLDKKVYVLAGPTSTTQCKFEVCDARSVYKVLYTATASQGESSLDRDRPRE